MSDYSSCQQERAIKIQTLISILNMTGKKYVPVAVSNHHLHLSQQDAEILFGKGYTFKQKVPLVQPGQYACEETVTISGPKGSIAKMRVLGPFRKETQVEITVSDCFSLGIKPFVRMSGELEGTPGCKITGPLGSIDIPKAVIVSRRHLHLSASQATALGLKQSDAVSLVIEGGRPGILEDVVVRCGDGHEMEIHIDTDEANAFQIKSGTIMEIR